WMGVPVVTRVGETILGRGGLSILTTAGLGDLVAHADEELVRLAARLAESPERLSRLRASLRGQMEASPLMDAPRFAAGFEDALRAMWRTWCAAELAGVDPP